MGSPLLKNPLGAPTTRLIASHSLELRDRVLASAYKSRLVRTVRPPSPADISLLVEGLDIVMSFLPFHVNSCFAHSEGDSRHVNSYESYEPAQRAQPASTPSRVSSNSMSVGSIAFQYILPEEKWVDPAHLPCGPQVNMPPDWNPHLQSLGSSAPCSSYDPFAYMQPLEYDARPNCETYSSPSTTASDQELPYHIDTYPSSIPHSLPTAPVVPSSSRETPLVHARLRTRRPSKEAPRTAIDDRKYTCDFCPVQMARLHDINRHMRIHTGVHPYACIGCGETFRRTDARTRHWCKQPECFTIHSTKEPASKTRRRIPTS
ncbi:hypothetical protein FRC12_000514 [Ceratobasidium sp. 428]|nr:hypothetical protein FRC12_000514 [Ceratobasidium sp. 428]